MTSSDAVNQKLFSIILATYNCGRKVENTLRSILSQNKELFELIVVDGASTDETLDYIKKYENRLTLISQPDKGVYDAFNKGIERATGEYLYFIGGGDCLRADVLSLVKTFVPTEAPAFIYGDAFFISENIIHGGEFCPMRIKTQNICHQSIFYHRDIFKLHGKYEKKYKIYADWSLNLKCYGNPKIKKQYIQHLIADFEGGGLSANTIDTKFLRHLPRLIRKNFGVESYLQHVLPLMPFDAYSKFYVPHFRPYIQALKHSKGNINRLRNLLNFNKKS